MGFFRGVITGIGIAAAAAAWYMSRSGQEFRDRYRVDRKLRDFGDEIEGPPRDVRAKVGPMVADVRSQAEVQISEMRSGMTGENGSTPPAHGLDDGASAGGADADE